MAAQAETSPFPPLHASVGFTLGGHLLGAAAWGTRMLQIVARNIQLLRNVAAASASASDSESSSEGEGIGEGGRN